MSQHSTLDPHATEHPQPDTYQMDVSRWTTGRNVLMFAALASVIACLAGYFTNPARLFQSYLVAFAFTSVIGLGAMFFVQVQFLTGSAWSVTMRRIMENVMITLPMGLILFIPVALGLEYIYPWMNQQLMQTNPTLKLKAGFLNQNWFIIRTVIYFFLWSLWIGSDLPAVDPAGYRALDPPDAHRVAVERARSFLVIAVGTLAAYDWLMSLEPTWYSTIFGLVTLADGGLAFMATVALICLGFRRAGILRTHHAGALPRSGQVAVRDDRVLHLRGVFAIHADLVRQHSGRNAVVSPPHGRKLAVREPGDALPALP
jgi:hypothetical protein